MKTADSLAGKNKAFRVTLIDGDGKVNFRNNSPISPEVLRKLITEKSKSYPCNQGDLLVFLADWNSAVSMAFILNRLSAPLTPYRYRSVLKAKIKPLLLY